MLIFILLFQLQSNSNTKVKLNTNTIQNAKFTLEKIVSIRRDGLFYSSIYTTISPNKDILILDHGNRRVHIFDMNGKKKLSFGKEGNGPGEFHRSTGEILTTKNYIIVNMRKLFIFDYNGQLKSEIHRVVSDFIEVKRNKIYFYRGVEYPNGDWLDVYNIEGKLLFTQKNNRYKKENYSYSPNKILSTLIKRFQKPKQMMRYRSGFVQRFNGEYRFQLLDSNRVTQKIVTRDFKAIEDKSFFNIPVSDKGKVVGEALRIVRKGNMNDISSILGELNNFLFLQTATASKKQINIDIISPEISLYSQLTQYEEDPIISAKISEGMLVLNLKNDEIGPYVKIYKIRF